MLDRYVITSFSFTNLRDRLLLWRGWHRREKGWVIKIYCHFQSMTHSNIELTKKQCQQSCVNTICKSIRVTILIIFRFIRRQMVSPKNVYVQTLDCRKLHKQLSNSCHRSGKGHMCRTTKCRPFIKSLARGGYLLFN